MESCDCLLLASASSSLQLDLRLERRDDGAKWSGSVSRFLTPSPRSSDGGCSRFADAATLCLRTPVQSMHVRQAVF